MSLRFQFLSIFIAASFFTATAEAVVPPVPSGARRIVASWDSYAGPLNPHLYNPNQMYAQRMVYDPLVAYRSDGTIGAALADRWEISPDGKVYTFYLKKNVKFSDGSPLTAHVVVKNFDAVMSNANRHRWLDLVNQMEKWIALDDHTFQLTVKHPYAPLLNELSLIRPLRILGEAGFPEDGDTSKGIKAPIGTGAWILAESKKGEYDLFKANPHWWGGKPVIDEVLIRVIADPTARALAFETGEIDLIFATGQIDMETFKRYQATPGIVTRLSAPRKDRSLAINSALEPTNDRRVRLALWHGINRASLLKHVFLHLELPAETLFAPHVPYCNLNLSPKIFDPVLAGQLLDEAGWMTVKGETFRQKNGQILTVDLCFVGNDALQKAASEAIQGDLRALGINVKLVAEEPDSYYKRQKTGEFHMIFSGTWGAPYDPASYCSSMRAPSHADYQAQKGLAQKAELDRRISEVLVETDVEKRNDEFAWILGTLHEEAIYIPLSYTTDVLVYRDALIADVPFGSMAYEMLFELISLR